MTTLELTVCRFVEHKRALGRKYESEEAELRLLTRYAEEHGASRLEELTPVLLDDFLASRSRPRPHGFNHLLGVVRRLLNWAVAHELLEASPLQTRPRRETATRIPFLFNVTQARRLLDAAAALPDYTQAPQRGATYRTIFALCYGLGLRVGEASALRVGDVDRTRNLLVVRRGKFGKSRLVPHGPRIAELVGQQLQRRSDGVLLDDDAPLFTFDGERSVHPRSVSATFHRLVLALGFTAPPGVSPPVLHSLRHSFAVGCLLRFYRQGLDPAARLGRLSTFMGHVDPVSTSIYLTITPALMEEANRRYEAFAEPVWSEMER
ncbi:MAG: tyrosine-type recombinase/integrase [Actinomycetota bacterium]|nr:tyrosine-type recombinase/integrase [Actinomycetota bacterium]